MKKREKKRLLNKLLPKIDSKRDLEVVKKRRKASSGKIKKQSKIQAVEIGDLRRKRRMRNSFFIVFSLLGLLIVRIGWIQMINGSELQTKAYLQQTSNRRISPKRGNIYDASGKVELAVSSTVETITVNPVNIDKDSKEKLAKELSEIFELDYDKVLKKITKHSSIETVAKKVDKEKADKLRIWMKENNITSGVNIDEDTKRYYPYNSLASQIIGFCGSDNQGLDGIEAIYEEDLKGKNGQIKKVTNAKGGEISKEGENYEGAIDGNDLILTIDSTIQGITEKYLKEACIDNKCTDGGNIVIMNPKNGDILAMAGYPNYNLNEPYFPNTEELKLIWETLPQNEKTKNLQAMWRNKAVSDTYEPGSTFKLLTASAALEEGLTTTDKQGEFCCTGSIEIAGVRIKCWRYYRPHGSESLREALMNSCNPVFIGLGQKIGKEKYYQYLRKFGMLEKTKIDLPGEANSIFLAEEKVGPIELGTIAFGQRFEVTPIQMVRMVGTIANKGTRVQPRIVKQIIDSQTKEERNIEIIKEENVISEKTANDVLSMMGTVVDIGTGKNAQVKGYSIGGKTGTSEDGVNTNKYVTSFIGVSPLDSPEVVILITLYNPTGEGGHQGGGVAAPVASKVLGEVLPYLEVTQNNFKEGEEPIEIEVPNLIGVSENEARKILKEQGLELDLESSDGEEKIIKNQIPKAGISVKQGTKIICE